MSHPLLRRPVVPLWWKLVVLIAGLVLLVTSGLLVAHATALAPAPTPTGNGAGAQTRTFAGLALANALVWTIVASTFAGLYVRRITIPLAQIAAAAARIEAGDLDVQVPVPEADEVGLFALRFNRLVAALGEQRGQNRHLLEELSAANAKLAKGVQRSERLAALGTLSAGLAHQLNNLLHCINGYAAVMQSEVGSTGPLAGDLSRVRHDAQCATELIERFLIFARPAAPQKGLADLCAIVQSCLAMLAVTIGRHGIRVEQALDQRLGPISGDAVLLEQAIFNVLINAVQAMPEGGTLSVGVAREGPDRAVLRVSDTGIGIAPEDMPRIFDPFFTTKGPGEGTGLGLAITHRILEQHGGEIDIASEPGQGTRVRMELPLVAAKEP